MVLLALLGVVLVVVDPSKKQVLYMSNSTSLVPSPAPPDCFDPPRTWKVEVFLNVQNTVCKGSLANPGSVSVKVPEV